MDIKMKVQLDFFGGEIDFKTLNEEFKKDRLLNRTIKGRFRKKHGYHKEHRCKECKHHEVHIHGKRRFHKCMKIGVSGSEATDIRLKDYSCDLFKKRSDKHDE